MRSSRALAFSLYARAALACAAGPSSAGEGASTWRRQVRRGRLAHHAHQLGVAKVVVVVVGCAPLERTRARRRRVLTRERRADALVVAAAVLLRDLAQHLEHRVDVDGLHQVVDGHDVRADAVLLEALARRAVVAERVAVRALGHAALRDHGGDGVQREAVRDELIEPAPTAPTACALVRACLANMQCVRVWLTGMYSARGSHHGKLPRTRRASGSRFS